MIYSLRPLMLLLLLITGIVISSSAVACAPGEENIASDLSTSFILPEPLHANKAAHHHNTVTLISVDKADVKPSEHECKCCDNCRCPVCGGCNAHGSSAAVMVAEAPTLGFMDSSKVTHRKTIYLSLSSNPLEHPPK